ncbi:DUF805 domain-containing protein [Leptothrix discophora]|uniref:DUF805 domain-containing protein n=1 Tax=Leptothrix discophora TaxID=89 RepID=A0ABT9G5T8_LEPDI|nr:DUF805 domain-containing protein [Leptothrix discophora]MDP4301854.1 DUF805 domain-containing protein [Leptothrix discophora]
MGFTDAVRTCFTKYVDFKGRASRSEFWNWALFNLIASIVLGILSDRLSLAFAVATLLPYIAVATRRLHDTGRGGWAQLVGLIPLIGWIVVLVWLVRPGEPGPNRYGPEPS